MRQPLIDAVRGLDPAAGAPDLDGDAMLARIQERARGSRPADVAHLVPRNRSRPARRLAMGAAALSAIVAVALVLTLTQGARAYASWVAQPTLVPAEAAARDCPATAPGAPGADPLHVEPVVAERRGSYTYVLLVGDGVFQECLIGSADGEFYAMAQGAALPATASLDVGSAPALVLVPGEAWFSEGSEGPITTIVGLAADDVTAVRVTTAEGRSADAAIVDGWWTVWFPGEVEVSDDLVVSTPDGEGTYSLEGLVASGLG